jgi:hypothetical protein
MRDDATVPGADPGPEGHDQGPEPPTPDGEEPNTSRLDLSSEPGSDPDPVPGEA